MRDGQGAQAAHTKIGELRKRRGAVHGERGNDPQDDGEVRLGDGVLGDLGGDLGRGGEDLGEVLLPGPVGLGAQEVELGLDVLAERRGEGVQVAPAGVGLPGAEGQVRLHLVFLGVQGGLDAVPEARAALDVRDGLELQAEALLGLLGQEEDAVLLEGLRVDLFRVVSFGAKRRRGITRITCMWPRRNTKVLSISSGV